MSNKGFVILVDDTREMMADIVCRNYKAAVKVLGCLAPGEIDLLLLDYALGGQQQKRGSRVGVDCRLPQGLLAQEGPGCVIPPLRPVGLESEAQEHGV